MKCNKILSMKTNWDWKKKALMKSYASQVQVLIIHVGFTCLKWYFLQIRLDYPYI